jgi:hypothetical protein
MGCINHQKYGWLIIVLPTLVIYVVYVCSPRQTQEEELRADELRAAGLLSTGEDVSPEEQPGSSSGRCPAMKTWETWDASQTIWDVQHGKHGNSSSNREIFP